MVRTITESGTKKRASLNFKVAAELGADIVAGRIPVGTLISAEPGFAPGSASASPSCARRCKLLQLQGAAEHRFGHRHLGPAHQRVELPRSGGLRLGAEQRQLGRARSSSSSPSAMRSRPAAAAEAARNASLEQLYALESALEVMEGARDNFAQWIEGDVAFHTALYVASNNVFMAPLRATCSGSISR